MGRLGLRKGEVSLSVYSMKYFLLLLISVLPILIAATFLFQLMMAFEWIYPANYAEQQILAQEDSIKSAEKVTEELIPELCNYAVFSKDGEFLYGNIITGLDAARDARIRDTSDGYGNYYKAIERESQYCVLQYRVITQYRLPVLRKMLPPPLITLMTLTLLIVSAIIIAEAILFGKLLNKKLQSIVDVANKVKAQELEFEVKSENIKEINEVLAACDEMKEALRESLTKEWKAEQMRKEQISALAHDLKTPLTIIRGNSELLYDTPLSEEQKECTDYIYQGCGQIGEYLAQMILATKSGDALKLHKQMVEIAPFIDTIKRETKGFTVGKKIEFTIVENNTKKAIMMDEAMMLRAVMNVLSNAVDHTHENGEIKLKIYEEEDWFCVMISDSGEGFSKAALKYATQQFYMDEGSRTSDIHYGMGLYIADTIAHQHDGEVILRNDSELGGAQVIIRIRA